MHGRERLLERASPRPGRHVGVRHGPVPSRPDKRLGRRDSLHTRPGGARDGNISLRRIIGHLLEAGYDGAFDLEVLGPTAEDLGYEAVITRGVAWLDEEVVALGVAR